MHVAELTWDMIDDLNDVFEAANMCDDLSIDYGQLEDVDELKMLLLTHWKKHRHSTSEDPALSHLTLEETLEEDSKRLTRIRRLYEDLIRFLKSGNIDETVGMELEQYSPGYKQKLEQQLSNLCEHECPIVIAGETGAGKSTILNLLLGETILPEAVLHSTSTFCHLKNGDTKTVTLVDKDGGRETRSLEDPGNMAELEKIIQRSDSPYTDLYITWPINILKGHVSIVDTPGIGEPEMTQRVMEFLPRAAAFIYVVNTANAGGIQKDRLIKVVKRQCSMMGTTDTLQLFDPQSAIFVLNKWDTVPEAETDDVLDKVYDSLRPVWHGLTKDQLYLLSATKAARCLKGGAGRTQKFSSLWDAIERLIPVSLEMNSRAYFDYLWMILKNVQKIIYMRVSNAKESQKEKREKETNLRGRLTVLHNDADIVMNELGELIESKCNDIVDQLYDYIRSPEVFERLSTWDPAEVPDGNDIDIISYAAEELIKERIMSEFMEWRDKSNVFDNLLDQACQMFKEKFRILDDEFSQWEKELDFRTKNESPEVDKRSDEEGKIKGLFGKLEGVVLGLTLPLWAPLALVAAVVALPVIGSLAVKEAIRQKTLLSKFQADSSAHMRQWTEQVIEKLTKPVLRADVVDHHIKNLREKVELLKQMIPRQLEADKQLIINVLNDARSSGSILKLYTPLQRSCRALIAKYRLLRLQHFDPDKIKLAQIKFAEYIDRGTYADVHAGVYTKNGVRHRVAIKVLREQRTAQSDVNQDARRVQSAEVDILRNLQHENVVVLHGVVCEELPSPCFYIVMELCVGTLKDATFRKPGRISSSHKATTMSGQVARSHFRDMMKQILVGLQFIHEKGYVHRDIKLSNILLTANNTVKISDVGMSAYEFDITSTLCGTWSHVAPEVIQGRNYRQSADIYSVGIMMWELWYGCSAYSDDSDMFDREPMQLLWDVVDGLRPTFAQREWPTAFLIRVMAKCWAENPLHRPTAADLVKIIGSLNFT